jgi:hypothetical protein
VHQGPVVPGGQCKGRALINDIVIGEETDVGPDGSYVSHLAFYLRAMRTSAPVRASSRSSVHLCSSAHPSKQP